MAGQLGDKPLTEQEVTELCYQIISSVGTAKSLYIDSISKAQDYHFDEAQQLVKEGDEAFIKGRNAHLQLLAHNAKGQNIPIKLLLIHAEDQLSDTETVRTLADKFIDVYRRLQQMEV